MHFGLDESRGRLRLYNVNVAVVELPRLADLHRRSVIFGDTSFRWKNSLSVIRAHPLLVHWGHGG